MAGAVQKAAEAKAAERDDAATADLTLREAVRASESAFKMALPDHIKVDRFIRAAFTAINIVPKLGECTQQSVLAGLMQAAQLGLEVSDVRGQCFLIPRKDNRAGGVMKASFQLGYRGMIDLAARSGITVDAEELHANDQFDFSLGTNRFLHHRPTLDERGRVLAYYATATFADGRTPAFTIMSVHEIEEHRDKFASSRDYKTKEITGPWVDHFDAMARKGLALDTPIPTPFGWTTMERLDVGDVVFDRYGSTSNVISVSEIKYKPLCYRVTFGDGDSVVCDDEHIWVAKIGRQRYHTMEPRPIVDLYEAKKAGTTVTVPVTDALVLPPADLPIDPWVLGYWLGNGRKDTPNVTSHSDDADEVVAAVRAAGYRVGAVRRDPRGSLATSIAILGVSKRFAELGVIGCKHVPAAYLRGSIDQRLALLRGLMDSDGSVDRGRGRVSFVSTQVELRDAVAELARSLGELVNTHQREVSGYGKTVTAFEAGWKPEILPFAITRKGRLVTPRKVYRYRRVASIERIDTVATKCIAVDSPTHTFLAGKAMIPTHNTVIRALLNYLPVSVELRDAIREEAIEATASEVSTVDYSANFQVPQLPDGVDGATGEIDPTTVTETTGSDEPPVECTGAADCPASDHLEGCFAVTELVDDQPAGEPAPDGALL